MGLVVILASTVVAMSAVAQLWEDEWEVLLISLQVSKVGEGQDVASPRTLTTGRAFITPLFLHQGAEEQAGVCIAGFPVSSTGKWT